MAESASIIALGREGSQLPVQNHQGPQGFAGAGLGTTTARGLCLSSSIEWGNASIIAPGREGSQSARLPGYGRKVKPRSAPARAVSGQGRLGVSVRLVAPLMLGGVRPVESAGSPPRRHTKARRRLSETAGLGTAAARREPSQQQYLQVAVLGCFDYRAWP